WHLVIVNRPGSCLPGEGVAKQLLRDVRIVSVAIFQESGTQFGRSVEPCPVDKRAGRINWHTAVGSSPLSRQIEILECRSDRLERQVTVRASGIAAVLFHAATDRTVVILYWWNVRRRVRRSDTEKHCQNHFSTFDRRRPVAH